MFLRSKLGNQEAVCGRSIKDNSNYGYFTAKNLDEVMINYINQNKGLLRLIESLN